MGNSASSQGSSTGTHDGDVESSISEEQHDWPIEQAADTSDIQSLQEMRKPYRYSWSFLPFGFRKDVNDLVWRAMRKAIKEPSGLLRDDGKRPDGSTLMTDTMACRQINDVGPWGRHRGQHAG